VRRVVSVPVHVLMPGMFLPAVTPLPLDHFGLSRTADRRFTFLFVFHLSSGMARKNPLGLLAAFRAAFRAEEPVDLVLKVTSFGPNGRNDAGMATLREAAMGLNVQIVDQVLSTNETLALVEACDAYVSLHRSEGLGLSMAEAMLLGRPVIASRYSGNLDFMTDDNSLLVPGRLVAVGPDIPPHEPDALWFDPSLEEAARRMRQLYEHPSFCRELGERARRNAVKQFCPHAAGQRMIARLQAIGDARRLGLWASAAPSR
jgi:glycosyltransferase involved in cell wall biosynthesis